MKLQASAIARLESVTQRYGAATALDDVTLEVPRGRMVGLVGPDGVGKSSLLAIVAGARLLQSGRALVLGGDMSDAAHRRAVCPSIAYMPQGLGKNLYPDLSVRENIEFFARVFGRARSDRDRRLAELLESTGLLPFADRPARNLSGGMRQKLGLCCSLIHDPELLILDEPTTGVDPLSRRQFWDLIARIRARRPSMSALIATAYMEEAEQFDWLVAMNQGRVLATGTPAALEERLHVHSVEDAFIALLPNQEIEHQSFPARPLIASGDPVIVASGLTRRFGDFTAVDHVDLSIARGEVFGFVGSNGCGKTTTMKMLTGLLPASAGQVLQFGARLDAGDLAARRRVGYMSQSFSLYTELTVRQNLDLHVRLFHLKRDEGERRIAELVTRFGLAPHLDRLALDLPLGLRQRLSLAVAIVHHPEILILDEPTSGVDPVARNHFWDLLLDLSRNEGVTIFISTHFMNEAERCDRIALMDAGRVLAIDTPAGLIAARSAPTLEAAFIAYLELAAPPTRDPAANLLPDPDVQPAPCPRSFSIQRLLACSIRESLEIIRDRIRLGFAVLGTGFLMLVFGFGISTDVNVLRFAVLDRDNTHASRTYLEAIRGSRYFVEIAQPTSEAELEQRLSSGGIDCAVEIPPGFGRDLSRGRPVSIVAWIDGARPFVAQTVRGYLEAAHQLFLADPTIGKAVAAPVDVAVRFEYNESFESVYAMVPATMSLELALFPAILMALAVVREKELGSITNLYVTPLTRLEFLVGKQLPYIALAMLNFTVMFTMALIVFQLPFKGDFPTLLGGTLVYVTAATAYGTLISAFARTQIAALFGTAIMTVLPATMFAGMLVPVSSLTGMARIMGRVFPMTYYLPVSVGTFTKGLGFRDLAPDLAALAVFVPALLAISVLLLRKQER